MSRYILGGDYQTCECNAFTLLGAGAGGRQLWGEVGKEGSRKHRHNVGSRWHEAHTATAPPSPRRSQHISPDAQKPVDINRYVYISTLQIHTLALWKEQHELLSWALKTYKASEWRCPSNLTPAPFLPECQKICGHILYLPTLFSMQNGQGPGTKQQYSILFL